MEAAVRAEDLSELYQRVLVVAQGIQTLQAENSKLSTALRTDALLEIPQTPSEETAFSHMRGAWSGENGAKLSALLCAAHDGLSSSLNALESLARLMEHVGYHDPPPPREVILVSLRPNDINRPRTISEPATFASVTAEKVAQLDFDGPDSLLRERVRQILRQKHQTSGSSLVRLEELAAAYHSRYNQALDASLPGCDSLAALMEVLELNVTHQVVDDGLAWRDPDAANLGGRSNSISSNRSGGGGLLHFRSRTSSASSNMNGNSANSVPITASAANSCNSCNSNTTISLSVPRAGSPQPSSPMRGPSSSSPTGSRGALHPAGSDDDHGIGDSTGGIVVSHFGRGRGNSVGSTSSSGIGSNKPSVPASLSGSAVNCFASDSTTTASSSNSSSNNINASGSSNTGKHSGSSNTFDEAQADLSAEQTCAMSAEMVIGNSSNSNSSNNVSSSSSSRQFDDGSHSQLLPPQKVFHHLPPPVSARPRSYSQPLNSPWAADGSSTAPPGSPPRTWDSSGSPSSSGLDLSPSRQQHLLPLQQQQQQQQPPPLFQWDDGIAGWDENPLQHQHQQ
jgi:hypothetical protein